MTVVTGKWEVVVWDQGPRQTCNVALQVSECHSQELLNYIKRLAYVMYIQFRHRVRFPFLSLT